MRHLTHLVHVIFICGKKVKLQLAQLSRGARLTYTNAKELYADGNMLRRRGSISRALFMHQISLEECGKVEIIGAWATNLFIGSELDIPKMAKAFRSHKDKKQV